MTEMSSLRIVPREEVAALFRERFGTDNVAWSIQPGDDSSVGQGTWLNYFVANPEDDSVVIGRQDEKFFQIRVRMRREGYMQPVTYEEPRVPHPTNGRPRVVGYVRVYINNRGFVQSKTEGTLMGDTLMIHPSSLSKDEDILSDSNLLGSWFFNTNPQRIEGFVEVELLHREFPDDEPGAMRVREIVVLCPDGRSLSVGAKIMAAVNA